MDEFERAISEQMKKLKAYALKLSKSADRADDLVQETLMRALVKRHQFQEGTNVKAWLFTICKNHFLSEARKNGRMVGDPEDFILKSHPGQDDQQGALIAKDALTFIIYLPEDQQKVAVMAANGLSYEEMSDELQISLGTVKSRLNRARKALCELIDDPDLMLLSDGEAA